MKSLSESNPVSALLKGFGIIELLSAEKASLAEIARKMGLPKSSAHRLLATLIELGVVCKTESEDMYALTPRLFTYGARALNALDIVSTADSAMRRLRDITQETVHLAVRSQNAIVYLHKVDSAHSLRMYSRIGFQAPLYATSLGKCLIAWLSESELVQLAEGLEYYKYTPHTLTSCTALVEHLAGVREVAYACDDEEHEPGVICFGVPVCNQYGEVIAAMSVSTPKFRYDADKKIRITMALREAGQAVSERFCCPHYPPGAGISQTPA